MYLLFNQSFLNQVNILNLLSRVCVRNFRLLHHAARELQVGRLQSLGVWQGRGLRGNASLLRPLAFFARPRRPEVQAWCAGQPVHDLVAAHRALEQATPQLVPIVRLGREPSFEMVVCAALQVEDFHGGSGGGWRDYPPLRISLQDAIAVATRRTARSAARARL